MVESLGVWTAGDWVDRTVVSTVAKMVVRSDEMMVVYAVVYSAYWMVEMSVPESVV